MEIKVLDTTEREEVGFIHQNGALVLSPFDNEHGPIVIGGVWGNYEGDGEDYFVWRINATRILYRGDKVEITL